MEDPSQVKRVMKYTLPNTHSTYSSRLKHFVSANPQQMDTQTTQKPNAWNRPPRISLLDSNIPSTPGTASTLSEDSPTPSSNLPDLDALTKIKEKIDKQKVEHQKELAEFKKGSEMTMNIISDLQEMSKSNKEDNAQMRNDLNSMSSALSQQIRDLQSSLSQLTASVSHITANLPSLKRPHSPGLEEDPPSKIQAQGLSKDFDKMDIEEENK